MVEQKVREPTVLLPYPGPSEAYCNDIFVYLRPETNGVIVESTLLRVIRNNSNYKNRIKLVYLANIPGDFIVENRIVEEHYGYKLYFTVKGKAVFTPFMKERFENYFHTPFEEAPIIGAFEALRVFNISHNELFEIRVPEEDMLLVDDQSIKKIDGYFVINYDIPAIINRNNYQTDIATMILRTNHSYDIIHEMIQDMGDALIKANILKSGKPLSRIFHYSRGPFDQIRDAIGYLYDMKGEHEALGKTTFCNYLLERGITMNNILYAMRYPIMHFRADSNNIIEDSLFSYTENDSFERALEKYLSITSQVILF